VDIKMAKMFPSELPAYVMDDPYRDAEIEVYNRLRDETPDEFVCYYSRPWLGLDKYGNERDGEADFVVAHPDKGLLVIEVKGGTIVREEGSEQWKSTNRHGITNKIKDPVKQASDSKYELLKKLKDQPDWGNRFITLRHGVIFPDSGRPVSDLGPSMPLRIFLFAEEMRHMADWLEARFSASLREDGAPGMGLDIAGMDILHQMVAGRIELTPNLARALGNDRKKIEILSAEQIDVLDALESHTRVAISGGAGTGKTVLALEKASRLANNGRRTLLLCYNAPLSDHLKHIALGIENLKCASFFGFCHETAVAAEIHMPPTGSPAYWTELPNLLRQAMQKRPHLKYDAVIVDEGQDFREEWLDVLDACLIDEKSGTFYLFFDDNQRVYSNNSRFAEQFSAPYYLTKNFRNTRSIHATTIPWYSGRVSRAVGPDGVSVDWVTAERPAELVEALHHCMSTLIRQHGIEPRDIAVLTGGKVENNQAVKGGKIGGYTVCRAGETVTGAIVFETIRRFKGLDRLAIILIDVAKLEDAELIYVALSRPSIYLAVVGGKYHIERLKSGT
jgi:hypothetical protein